MYATDHDDDDHSFHKDKNTQKFAGRRDWMFLNFIYERYNKYVCL